MADTKTFYSNRRTPLIRAAHRRDIARDLRQVESLNPAQRERRVGLLMVEAAEKAGCSNPAARSLKRPPQHRLVWRSSRREGLSLDRRFARQMSAEKSAAARLRRGGCHHGTNVPPDSPESYNGVATARARIPARSGRISSATQTIRWRIT